MDASAVVLHKLLKERNLDIWSRIKLVFLDPAFSSLYSAIAKYYDQYSTVPSFQELELSLREGPASRSLATLQLIDAEEISAEVAVNALIDQYTQNETVKLLDKFIDNLPVYDTEEIKENLSGIVQKLDEKTLTTENFYSMSDIMLFKTTADLARDRIPLGLNNTFDATLAGVARQELILLGAPRGSGKSIVACNIQVNQYEMGNVCPMFSIEMLAHECFEREMAMLAGVNYVHIKQNTLTPEELLKVIKVRAGMFQDADDLVEEFKRTHDKYKFESRLVREKSLKADNQIIIIDDRQLSLTALDLHMGKIKAKHGDKFAVCVVDYLNQMTIDGSSGGFSQFDWQPQVVISKGLKNLARKHDVIIFSPYQVDATGEARFAKGILDAADIAMVLTKGEDSMTLETTKIRSGAPLKVTSPINWEQLRISPQSLENPQEKQTVKRAGKKKQETKAEEPAQDLSLNWDQ